MALASTIAADTVFGLEFGEQLLARSVCFVRLLISFVALCDHTISRAGQGAVGFLIFLGHEGRHQLERIFVTQRALHRLNDELRFGDALAFGGLLHLLF